MSDTNCVLRKPLSSLMRACGANPEPIPATSSSVVTTSDIIPNGIPCETVQTALEESGDEEGPFMLKLGKCYKHKLADSADSPVSRTNFVAPKPVKPLSPESKLPLIILQDNKIITAILQDEVQVSKGCFGSQIPREFPLHLCHTILLCAEIPH